MHLTGTGSQTFLSDIISKLWFQTHVEILLIFCLKGIFNSAPPNGWGHIKHKNQSPVRAV